MKKTFLKLTSALTAFCLIFGTVASAAAVQSGGTETDYNYYWCQDFNDLPEGTQKSGGFARWWGGTVGRYTVNEETSDYAIKFTSSGNGVMPIDEMNGAVTQKMPQFDFSKGSMVLSYDFMVLTDGNFYFAIRSSAEGTTNPNAGDNDLFHGVRFKDGTVYGYDYNLVGANTKVDEVAGTKSDPNSAMVSTGKTYDLNKKYQIQISISYNDSNGIMTAKYYLDGEPLMNVKTNELLEYKFTDEDKTKMQNMMNSKLYWRFNAPVKNSECVIDNLTVRSEGKTDLPLVGWIGANTQVASIEYTDTAKYDPDCKPSGYPRAINKITASQTELSDDNEYYTLTKYDAVDNPLLLKAGTPAKSKVGWKSNNGMNVSGLDITSNNEFYILKLKGNSLITNLAGEAVSSPYICLCRAAMGSKTIVARETEILDGSGNTITLDADGKLPTNAKAIRFITAPQLSDGYLSAENVKMTGTDGKNFTGEQSETEPNVWTINITEDLTEGTEYTVTVGDFSQTITTTGKEPPSEDAAVTSGGQGTEYGYYWNQNFNALPEDMSKAKSVRKVNADLTRANADEGDYSLNITATNSAFAIIDNNKSVTKPLPKFDFSKGPMILSFDVTMNNLTSPFYLVLRSSEDADTDMLGIIRIQNTGRICGYTKKADLATDYATKAADLSFTASNKIATEGTTYHIQTALVYDEENQVLTVKQYLNGEPMTLKDTSTPIEYKYQAVDKTTMDSLLSGDMFMRFAVPTKGGSVKIDNITLRSEGTMNIDGVSYISPGDTKANIIFTDNASYAPENSPSSYVVASNAIPLNQNLTGDNDYYTLTKYSADNPLLLKAGTAAASKVSGKGNSGMTISGLDIANDREFYILKLKSPSAVTSFAGDEPQNMYSCIRRAALGEGTIAARETIILDGDGKTLTLDSRDRLPASTKTIKFITSKYVDLTADKVKMTGEDGKSFTGEQSTDEPNVWTINIDELSELTDYTITLGDFSQTVRTDGYDPNAFYWYEGFDNYDGSTLPNGFSQPGMGISFTKTEISGNPALKYVNEYIPENSGTSNFSIKGTEPLDFSKGALLLSYDVTPQSNLTWLGDGAKSNILIPTLRIGSTEISQLSIIEHGGIKAAYKTAPTAWGRSAYLTGWENNTLVADTTVKFQLLLEKEGNKITATQYINEKPVYYTLSDEAKLASVTVDITEEELAKEWTLTMAGRRFPNGLVFDNFHITTVDGVKAGDEITIEDNAVTAQINLENTLQFSEDAPSIVKEIKMLNTVVSSDFRIKKYNIATDPLLLNGENVSGFDINNTGNAFVLSRLPERKSGEIFVIELSDISKIQTLVGKKIDTTVFKAGANPGGLKKTRLLDSEGDQMQAENGIVSPALAKMELIFTKNTKIETLPTITNAEKNYSLTAVLGEDGIYRFDFTGDGATLSPNTVYTVTYGDTSAQLTTGEGIVQSAVPVIDSDGKASTIITNTSETATNVYIISAYYNSEEDIVSAVKYEKFTVGAGKTENISMSEAHSAPTEWAEQRVFIWDGFEKMNPYCTYGSRKNQ